MNTLVSHLAEACREHRLREKWLIAPARRIAHQWLDQVTRAGFPVVNVRVETTRSLAIRLLAPQLAGGRPAVISGAASRLLVAAAWQRAVRAGGYLGSTAVTPRLLALAERTLLDLRMAGLRSQDLDPERFEPQAKGRDLRALLQVYESELVARELIDHADTLRRATEQLAARREAATSQALLIIPEDLRLTALERRFLEAFGPGRVLRLPVDQEGGSSAADSDRAHLAWIERPSEAPPPRGDGSVRIVRAIGEINEVRGALRSCLAEAIPLDGLEILYSAAEPYVPLLYDTALRSFGFDPAWSLGVPVTFADGIPARLARPGRLLRTWLDWIRRGFPQSDLLAMLQAGLLRLPVDEDGDPVGAARLARALRSLGIGFGRDRYLTCAAERIEGLARLSAGAPSGDDGDAGARDPERLAQRQETMKVLQGLLRPLIDASPLPDSPARPVVSAAAMLIGDRARQSSALDGLARERLLKEIQSMERALAAGDAPVGFDAWEWLGELPDRLRVGGSGPRPGCLHVASLTGGGHSGRGHTIILGLDDSRFPSAGHQDPLVLDAERRKLGGELALSGERLRQQMLGFAQLVCRLRGTLTLSYSSRNLDDDSECFASPVVLAAWRIISGERRGDHSALKRSLPAPLSFAPAEAQECLDAGEWWLWCACQEQPVRNYAELAAATFPHLERGRAAATARASEAFTVFDGRIEGPGPELDPTRPEGPVLSATGQLQNLGACPLRSFYRDVLGIRPPDDIEVDPERWLSHLDYGTLVHEVLFDFVGRLLDAGRWPPQPPRDLPLMEEVVESRAAEWLRKVPPPNTDAYRRQRREVDNAARIFLNEQARPRIARRPSVPVYLEAALGARGGPQRSAIDRADPVEVVLSPKATIRCRARLDRVDRRLEEDGAESSAFLVWDYKSGRSVQRFDPGDLYNQGRLVQHVLYMDIAQTVLRERFGAEATVDEFIFFFPSAAVHGRMVDYSRDIIPGGKQVIARLCALAARGAFLQTDAVEDCRYCDYRSACQAVNRDLKANCAQAARKLANGKNDVLAPFVELRVGG